MINLNQYQGLQHLPQEKPKFMGLDLFNNNLTQIPQKIKKSMKWKWVEIIENKNYLKQNWQ